MDGREVIDVFLPYIEVRIQLYSSLDVSSLHPLSLFTVLHYPQKLLSPRGSCYMVLVQENKPAEITRILEGHGLCSEVRVFIGTVMSECSISMLMLLCGIGLADTPLWPCRIGFYQSCITSVSFCCMLLADSDRQTGPQRGAGDPAQPPPRGDSLVCAGSGAVLYSSSRAYWYFGRYPIDTSK